MKRAMKDKADVQEALFGLVVNIEGAHNLVPVREEDWRHQCCRVEEDGGLYAQTVGTFGVESAAYFWERAAGALSCLTRYVVFRLHVMADDLDIEAARPDFRAALFVVFAVASVVGIPIAWKKVRGGTVVEWIGYELRLREYRVGVSAGRAAWAVKWCKGLREAGIANTAAVEEGVRRLSFIAGMLEYERPFLSAILQGFGR